MNAVPPALAPQTDRITLQHPAFISDLHLSEDHPATLARFLQFVAQDALQFSELLILGDLFEFWVGDDCNDAIGATVATALKELSSRGVRVFLMQGNRDLLLGGDFAARAGATLLADPTIADIGGEQVLLAHGDVYCTRDVDYMRFRAQVRNPDFQRMFLAKPLAERRAFVGQARAASEEGKQAKTMEIMDVTPAAIVDAMRAAGVRKMIHGHTHRPDMHRFDIDGESVQRWVLADWDLDTKRKRGASLRIRDGSWEVVALDG